MTLDEKEKEFDKEVKRWAEIHKGDRVKYWGHDWVAGEGPLKSFNKNEKENYCFEPVTDGSINAEVYENNNNGYRILFVAKEPHDREGDIESYRHNFEFQNSPSFWGTAQRAAYGIFNNINNYPETEINNYVDLQKTAFINIQKYRARRSTDMKYLKNWYLNYGCRELFEKQLEILNPYIIICLNICDIIWESVEKFYKIKNYEKKFYNKFAGEQQLNERAATSSYFTKSLLCIDCDHLSSPDIDTDLWVQGILTAFSVWKNM